MSEPDFLSISRVAILGLGLMGGSLALALRGHCQSLLAADPDPATLELARRQQVVDQLSSDPAEILPLADIIVLAAPVGAILSIIRELPTLHPGSPVVLDLGSTKVQICQALETLPPRFDPLGGHPMCGKETAGLTNADPAIFRDAPFAFTPLERSSRRASALANRLAGAIGARPVWLDPQTHDRWTAATSHLPYLVSAALARATPLDSAPLVGSGFRSTARLAATPPTMMLDVLSTNQENVLESLKRFRLQLDRIEEFLSRSDFQALERFLSQGALDQKELTRT